MIVFDLACQPGGHHFEGWFASSGDFVEQQARGLLCCPVCGSSLIQKAPMAPAVGRKGNQQAASVAATVPLAGGDLPPERKEAFERLAALQAEVLKQSRWVGSDFADESRAMHYGEREAEAIHGQATIEQARDLLEEGVAVLPLPFPITPPDELN